jgi:hypothetical protein
MEDSGLDRWVSSGKLPDKPFSKSLFPHERIILFSLNERILELERMRDQILYELDRLKSLSEDRLPKAKF